MAGHDLPEVLFVCIHNAGRSRMAAALLDRHAGGRLRVRSAGSDPAEVVTMGCGEACPIYPGKQYEDWELEDPAGRPVEVVRRIRDQIDARVQALLAELVQAGA
jgi:arsenate reductase (thioredoxin)